VIRRTCRELPLGGHFILLNGRDPAPLRGEIAAAWPEAFAWEYLVQKADEVRVKITRLKAVKPDSELAAGSACA